MVGVILVGGGGVGISKPDFNHRDIPVVEIQLRRETYQAVALAESPHQRIPDVYPDRRAEYQRIYHFRDTSLGNPGNGGGVRHLFPCHSVDQHLVSHIIRDVHEPCAVDGITRLLVFVHTEHALRRARHRGHPALGRDREECRKAKQWQYHPRQSHSSSPSCG